MGRCGSEEEKRNQSTVLVASRRKGERKKERTHRCSEGDLEDDEDEES